MRRLAREAGIWAFAALFGSISALGPGWHCVIGHSFHVPAACHVDHADTCCADHGHEPASEHESDKHTADEGPGAQVKLAEHDCPLCQYFAQVQWPVAFEPPLALDACVKFSFRAERAESSAHVELYRSRAPPVRAVSC
ncbi:MAG: hypothetical protein DWQ37_04600 [Planctomycetota bacterium]|nr:MAG: hypothetical protein DWQ37_04600 [Planctomycetota bacterium]